jgi:hypothetical protein
LVIFNQTISKDAFNVTVVVIKLDKTAPAFYVSAVVFIIVKVGCLPRDDTRYFSNTRISLSLGKNGCNGNAQKHHLDQQSAFAINAPLEIESIVVASISHNMGYKKSRSISKVLCPIHSFLDKQAKHTWVKCSINADNQTNPTLQSAIDAHLAAINNCYLINDDRSRMDSSPTEVVDDNGSVDRCLFSNDNNNFATFLAPPLPAHKKKFAEKNIEHMEKPAKKRG